MRIAFILAIIGVSLFATSRYERMKTKEVNMLTGFNLTTSKYLSEKTGIPTSVLMAQPILESAWGESNTAKKYNNFFGWRAFKSWKGKTGTNADGTCQAYTTRTESWEKHVLQLKTYPRYQKCWKCNGRGTKEQISKCWTKCLQRSGYCPSPDYDDKLNRIISHYNLTQHD